MFRRIRIFLFGFIRYSIISFNCFLSAFYLFVLSGCNTTEPPEDGKENGRRWEKISQLDGMDVKGFEILNSELYVYGWGDNNGLYKTSDGESWTKISLPDTGNFEYGVSAIAMRDDTLIVASAYSFDGKYLCKISSGGKIIVIPTQVPIEISDIEILGNDIIIAPGRNSDQYNAGILKPNGKLKFISNQLYTNPFVENECYIRNGINPIISCKLIKINNNSNYLVSGQRIGPNFVTKIDTNGYHCFGNKGLTTSDKFAGVYDLVWHKDTLFAATQRYVKCFSNNEWKIYKDSLPLNYGLWQIANSITFSENNFFVATTNYGVLYWQNNKWITMSAGLPHQKGHETYYPGISFIIAFKGNLFIGFGTEKIWDSGMRGVWKYSLK